MKTLLLKSNTRAARLKFNRAVCLFAIICLNVNIAFAHKFYVSFAQVEWNAETKSLEIAVRVFSDDLELALQRAAKRDTISLDKTPDVDKLLLAYLQQRLEIENAKGARQQLLWVGKELNVDSVWLYVESPMPEGLSDAKARNSLFFELYPDQLNTMSFKQSDKRNDVSWKRGDALQAVFETK